MDLSNMTTIKAGNKGMTQQQFFFLDGESGDGVWMGGKVL